MSSAGALLKPGNGWEFYPERKAPDEAMLDRLLANVVGRFGDLRSSRRARSRAIVQAADQHARQLEGLSDDELTWQATALRPELRIRGFQLQPAGRAFALVRETASRRLGLRHHDVQLLGGWAMLHGMVVEMATGEGKTLAATLPACAAALSGIPVHIVTVNDYLASRDAAWMAPVYETLGLRVGVITHDMGADDRREAYRCDVTYCTNKELVFDYLRDRLELGRKPGAVRSRLERLQGTANRFDQLRLRGLSFAIVDEADSVLIDEARTPLIISGPGGNDYEARVYRHALELSEELERDRDYRIDFAERDITLTEQGQERLAEIAPARGGIFCGRRRSEDLVRKALTARHLFQRDRHYVLKDDKVQIVDEYTGRVMPGRSWEGGLHQLIEAKEDCEVTSRTEVLGRISYQRFFRRYLALAGMTGTAREAAPELWSVYRLRVASIPSNRPLIRRALPDRIHRTAEDKWAAVVTRIAELHARGRPVLVGTRTVADSEQLSRELTAAELPHRVLNALQDQEEAEIVSEAGRQGRITVATNMAGRGTDIKLGPGVRELGGLHVLATSRHDAGRIDRQLFGRCGRQGDPGTYEAFVSLEDDLLETRGGRRRATSGSGWLDPATRPGRLLARARIRSAQRSAERKHFRVRRELLRIDESMNNALGFAGTGE